MSITERGRWASSQLDEKGKVIINNSVTEQGQSTLYINNTNPGSSYIDSGLISLTSVGNIASIDSSIKTWVTSSASLNSSSSTSIVPLRVKRAISILTAIGGAYVEIPSQIGSSSGYTEKGRKVFGLLDETGRRVFSKFTEEGQYLVGQSQVITVEGSATLSATGNIELKSSIGYLRMDGIDDYIQTPSMLFDEIEFDFIPYPLATPSWEYIIDGRGFSLDGYIAFSSVWVNGTSPAKSSSFTSYSVNGVSNAPIYNGERILFKAYSNDVQSALKLFCRDGQIDFLRTHVFSIKFMLNGANVAHYDMTTGTVLDQSGNGNHASLTGGTWIEEGTVQVVDSGAISFAGTGATFTNSKPEVNYYLSMNGTSDWIWLPNMNVKKIVMDGLMNPRTSGYTCITDARANSTRYLEWNGTNLASSGYTTETINQLNANKNIRTVFNIESSSQYTSATSLFANRVGSSPMTGEIYSIQVYDGNSTLVAHYDLSTGSVIDRSGNGNHAILYGGTWNETPRYYLSMDGIDDGLKTPSVQMNAVEIECLIETAQPLPSHYLLDARSGLPNGHVYQNGIGSDWTSLIVDGTQVTKVWSSIPKGRRVNVKFTANTFTDDINIFNRNIGTENLKGNIYKVTCYLDGVIKAQYDMSKGTVLDQSGNGNHATLTGGTWLEEGSTQTVDSGVIALTGAGGTSATARRTLSTAVASLSSIGNIAVNGKLLASSSVSLTGQGSASASVNRVSIGGATLSGTGAIGSTASSLLRFSSVSIQGSGTTSVAGRTILSTAVASLSSTGNTTVNGKLLISSSVALTGQGSTSVSVNGITLGGANLIGSGSMEFKSSSYYLSMDDVDDNLKTPTFTFNEVIINLKVRQKSGVWQTYYDTRTGGTGYLLRNLSGNDEFLFGSMSVWVNDVPQTSNTRFIPTDERFKLRMIHTSLQTDDVNILSRNNGVERIEGDIFSIEFYNGVALVAHYDMSNGTVLDQSGNGNHATLSGGTWVQEGGDATVIRAGSASFTSTGSLTASGTVSTTLNPVSGAATLSGTGALSATERLLKFSSSTLQGVGATSVTPKAILAGVLSISGQGSLSASAGSNSLVLASAALTATGTTTTTGRITLGGSIIISGIGNASLSGRIIKHGLISMQSSGLVSSISMKLLFNSVSLSGQGGLSSSAGSTSLILGSASFAGSSSTSSTGKITLGGLIQSSGQGSIEASGRLTRFISSALEAQGGVALSVNGVALNSASLSMTSGVSTIGIKVIKGIVSSSGTSNINATSLRLLPGMSLLNGQSSINTNSRITSFNRALLEARGSSEVNPSKIHFGINEKLSGTGDLEALIGEILIFSVNLKGRMVLNTHLLGGSNLNEKMKASRETNIHMKGEII